MFYQSFIAFSVYESACNSIALIDFTSFISLSDKYSLCGDNYSGMFGYCIFISKHGV